MTPRWNRGLDVAVRSICHERFALYRGGLSQHLCGLAYGHFGPHQCTDCGLIALESLRPTWRDRAGGDGAPDGPQSP